MELTFREWLEEDRLIESFDRNTNYKKLKMSEINKIMMEYYKFDSLDMLDGIYSQLPFLKGYLFKNEGREYFIYSFIINTVLDIHFFDIESAAPGTESDNKKFTKNSQPVFSAIVDIVLTELEFRPARKIRIVAPAGREQLYKKIIDKTLKKYGIEKDISLSISKDEDITRYHYLLEKEQDEFYIGIE